MATRPASSGVPQNGRVLGAASSKEGFLKFNKRTSHMNIPVPDDKNKSTITITMTIIITI
jgi:hypothetical protein